VKPSAEYVSVMSAFWNLQQIAAVSAAGSYATTPVGRSLDPHRPSSVLLPLAVPAQEP